MVIRCGRYIRLFPSFRWFLLVFGFPFRVFRFLLVIRHEINLNRAVDLCFDFPVTFYGWFPTEPVIRPSWFSIFIEGFPRSKLFFVLTISGWLRLVRGTRRVTSSSASTSASVRRVVIIRLSVLLKFVRNSSLVKIPLESLAIVQASDEFILGHLVVCC